MLGQPNFTSNTPATSQTGMNQPTGVAVDLATGKVFVSKLIIVWLPYVANWGCLRPSPLR